MIMATMILSLLPICLLSVLLSYGVVELEASHHVFANSETSQQSSELTSTHRAEQPNYRTGYHFQPPKNWMNDPNGPMIYRGIYHLFYQYNPKGAVWGNIVWAHSTSLDLVNWTPQAPAIYPSEPYDINGCWSGSVTILPDGKPVIFYTGVDSHRIQVQNLAYPKNLSDPFLREWVKIPQNPVIYPTLVSGVNASAFRDPTTAWLGPDKQWRVVMGSNRNGTVGMAYLYRSKDFLLWLKAKRPLHLVNKAGNWECPDFYPVKKNSSFGVDTSTYGPDVKHVFKVSLDDTRKDYYVIGEYDLDKDVFLPDKGSVDNDTGLRYDYGKFYASKTFFDSSKSRRVLWGWVNESSPWRYDVKKGWSGLQAIPRTIRLAKSGTQLVQWPITELEKLRRSQVQFSGILQGGSLHEVVGVTAAQADVDISFGIEDFSKAHVLDPRWTTDPHQLCTKEDLSEKGGLGPFGLLVLASKNLEEYTAVFFKIFREHTHSRYVVLLCSDQSRSSLDKSFDKATYGAIVNVDPVHQKLSLRTLIDHSIVESFAGEGKACITARVYPTRAIDGDARLYAMNYGNQSVTITGSAWSMRTAKIN